MPIDWYLRKRPAMQWWKHSWFCGPGIDLQRESWAVLR